MHKLSVTHTAFQTGLLLMLSSLLTACTNIALQAINTPSYLLSEHEVMRDVAYGNAGHQRLDLYLPAPGSTRKDTLVVFVYGGSWTSGAKESYYFVADALTANGYSVAIPDYIKYPHATFPTFVEDIALAVAWLSDNGPRYGQQDSLVVMGHSAGAHTGALLITDARYLAEHDKPVAVIDGFIGLAGPYGFKPKEKKFRNIFANLEDFNTMRPLHFVSGTEPPVFVLHGNKDSTVLPVNSSQFSEKINDMGGSAERIFYPDLGHINIVLGLSRVTDRDGIILRDILDFLEGVDKPGTQAAEPASIPGQIPSGN